MIHVTSAGSLGLARERAEVADSNPDEEAARRFEQCADELDPETAVLESAEELPAVAEAAETARRDEAVLAERVAAARARGQSWNRIALALGVSRQAARQRFAGKLGA